MSASLDQKWPDEDTNSLRQLWEGGYSASQIGKALGRTRNAVIGKVHRLGLPKRRERYAQGVRKVRVPKLKLAPLPVRVVQKKVTPMYTPPDEPVSLNLTLMHLELGQCRWPHGEGPIFFCGHPSHKASSYCEHHLHRSKAPPERKRKTEPKFFTWAYLGVAA
jgi:GcrA cell cycle regulator